MKMKKLSRTITIVLTLISISNTILLVMDQDDLFWLSVALFWIVMSFHFGAILAKKNIIED